MSFAYPDLDGDMVFEKLICLGIFPVSLEKIFTSKKFGSLAMSDETNTAMDIVGRSDFSLLPYKITQNTNVPRHLAIPHPLAYFTLSKTMRDYWDKIDKAIGENNNEYLLTSLIVPKDNDGRLVYMPGYEERRLVYPNNFITTEEKVSNSLLSLEKRLGAKFCAIADISGFFANIYSHSLPWALVGKNYAKSHRGHSLWFNQIDKDSRRLKNNETNGIPIGADTSHVLSEIILSQIDRALFNKGYKYLRYIDDYECFCESKEKAEMFLKDLGNELEKYQLKLNAKKTKIVEFPKGLNEEWINKLRGYLLPNREENHSFITVNGLLDLGLQLSKERGDYAPFKYALKMLIGRKFSSYRDYKQFFIYVCGITILYPYLINLFDDLINDALTSFESDKEDFKNITLDFLEKLLTEHVIYHRSDVIVWSFFLAIKYELTLNNYSDISDQVINTHDPIPTLMSYLYAKKNGESLDKYYDLLGSIDQREWWLYVYELYREDPVRVKSNISNLEYEIFYNYLKNNNISFIVSGLR